MEEKRKQLRRQIEELSLDERIMEMKSPVEDVETASNNKYHYISENSIQTLLDRAGEEGEIKGRLEALPITIQEVKNAKIKLLKRIISKYQKMGSSAGDYAMVYVEEELSKLTTK